MHHLTSLLFVVALATTLTSASPSPSHDEVQGAETEVRVIVFFVQTLMLIRFVHPQFEKRDNGGYSGRQNYGSHYGGRNEYSNGYSQHSSYRGGRDYGYGRDRSYGRGDRGGRGRGRGYGRY